jgi:hypothetical protein
MPHHIEATDLCEHCHHQFADHNYVPDSIDVYQCPWPIQIGESIYGIGYGRDHNPHNFCPDRDCCSADELDAWNKACEAWDKAEATGGKYQRPPGRWGVGIYWFTQLTTFKLHLPPDPDQTEFDFDA